VTQPLACQWRPLAWCGGATGGSADARTHCPGPGHCHRAVARAVTASGIMIVIITAACCQWRPGGAGGRRSRRRLSRDSQSMPRTPSHGRTRTRTGGGGGGGGEGPGGLSLPLAVQPP
jgi:hypothetical protein